MDLTPFHGPPAAAPHVPGFVARTLLGFGTHGEVWRADDLSTGSAVALKIGRRGPEDPAAASGDPPDARAEHETALLCRIDHPHIVRLQRVVALPAGGLAMVLDLAAGGSLASLVAARGRFDPGEVSTLLVPLADALEHLHRRGVVHGDIAPGNVLFTGDGRPQLGDLGVAQVLGSRIGGTWATPGFADPALTRPGAGGIDLQAADLWGLAAIGWFALTGRPPDPAVTGRRSCDRAPVLGELLTRCLTAEPADRPSLPELADRAWQAARPMPIRLVTAPDPHLGDSGRDDSGRDDLGQDDLDLPPLADRVTRPVPVAGGEGQPNDGGSRSPDGSVGAGDRASVAPIRNGSRPSGDAGDRGGGRFRRLRTVSGRRRGFGIVVGTAVATAVAGVGVAVTLGSTTLGSATGETGRGSPGPTRVGVTPATLLGGTTDPSPEVATELEAELTRALIAIGRSRSAAFGRASEHFLAGADVVGSPAYLADLELVQRLRSQGYRLQGVRYQVSGVRVLHRRGQLIDVQAVVTTSKHRQVRISSGVGVSVPQDGPRPVVLTVAPIDLNLSGPTRWRVRSVAVPS